MSEKEGDAREIVAGAASAPMCPAGGRAGQQTGTLYSRPPPQAAA
jgi:hypothetical protein